MSLLDRDQILRLFEELSEELVRRGTRAEIFLVGGAAMALAYDARRATRDIDAVFQPKDEAYFCMILCGGCKDRCGTRGRFAARCSPAA
jgi:hypothetical protein